MDVFPTKWDALEWSSSTYTSSSTLLCCMCDVCCMPLQKSVCLFPFDLWPNAIQPSCVKERPESIGLVFLSLLFAREECVACYHFLLYLPLSCLVSLYSLCYSCILFMGFTLWFIYLLHSPPLISSPMRWLID